MNGKKDVGKFNFGMKVLFGASLVTCTGYLVKHLMLVIYGIKARKLAKKKNDIFDDEVQKFLFLHRHSQSHLEQGCKFRQKIQSESEAKAKS